ncbi:DUF2742 domain-containing protein [Mycobacteroides abscessus]|uniref:DUF2742 domain-containing protein n=1 Tax=Mycobacteroides abscessus TaxID=36809 RepID=UPI000C262971|nr:DUF2742 domain-containing protein [Mycobacteroides abscessus]
MVNSKEVEAPVLSPGLSPASIEVSWWAVHEFITAVVRQANTSLPLAGTPAWCALSGGDPRKLLALAAAGEHHVLRIELDQLASAEASKAIAAAVDWGRVAHTVLAGRGPAYIPRKRAS